MQELVAVVALSMKKSVYDEYRRIGYRLKPISKYRQLTLFDIIEQKG